MEQRLIDKDELVESMVWRDDQGMIWSIDDVLDTIDTAPIIDPENLWPRSYWEDVYQTGPCSFSGRCHACGVRNDIPPVEQAYYCPHCGSFMKKTKLEVMTMKVEGKFGEWTIFDGTNPPATPGSYLVALVNSVEKGGPPLVSMYEWGQGLFDDETIDEAFYYFDIDWGDVPINPNEVLAWMPLPSYNFDWQTPTNEYWERMKELYGWQ